MSKQQQTLNQSSPRKRRVVVTGIGAVTPCGHSMPYTWNSVLEGAVTSGPVKLFDASEFPCKIAYEVDEFDYDGDSLTARERAVISRAARFGLKATREAIAQARLAESPSDPRRTAVCIGVGMTSPSSNWYLQEYFRDQFTEKGLQEDLGNFPFVLTRICQRLLGARGGGTTIHTACASSGQSLGEAFDMVAYGDADVVLTGGADSMISPFYFAGFCLLGALSKRNDSPHTASRPFDLARDGFVLGEGACMLVFEEHDHALARGATILGEVCGYGITESAYRITDLHPEGVGPIQAMQMALSDAKIKACDVGYINAHGTSTYLNDRIEALSISRVFNASEGQTHVSSTKSMTGHMISTAGAIEFALTLMALKHQVLPPSINLFEQDPHCEIKLTGATMIAHKMRYGLSNSVGFGGSNTALVAKRWES